MRVSYGGAVGLDYKAVEMAAIAKGFIKRSFKEKRWLFDGLQVMEAEFLKQQAIRQKLSVRKAGKRK
jgi:hypothetical protein